MEQSGFGLQKGLDMKPIKPDEEMLRYLYLEEGMAMKEIAHDLGISVGSVYNYMAMYGIPSRTSSEINKGKVVSEEIRRKLSEAAKGRSWSDETRKKQVYAHRTSGIWAKKKRSDGYFAVYFPDHPNANNDGYIMEHILVMECLIGRWIKDNEVVHHVNGDKGDNRAENLMLMTKEEHARYHMKKRWENGGVNHASKRIINKDTGEIYNSIKEAAHRYGISPTDIRNVCRKRTEHTHGYVFEYYKEGE